MPIFGSEEACRDVLVTMRWREAEKPTFEGRIEIDDTYLGGERSDGKRGRGTAGKTPIVAAVETTPKRKPRRMKLAVVKGFRKKEIEKLAKRDLAAGSNVVSDGLSCWPAVTTVGCDPFPDGHRLGQAGRQLGPVPLGEHGAGELETAIAGTYHHVSAKHAQSYLTSFAWRFNRRYQLDTIVERLAWAAAHTSPQPYKLVVADASSG